jgi:hypothetical protein
VTLGIPELPSPRFRKVLTWSKRLRGVSALGLLPIGITMSNLKDMSGTPIGTPGSAEGTPNEDEQSAVPPAAHTPGSAEGDDLPELEGEDSSSTEKSS